VRIDRGERRELRCSSVSDPTRVRLVVSETDRRPEIDGLKRRMGIRDETASGSVGLKLGLIAAGERDLYVNPTGNAKAWDTCAGTALLESAGGRITDLGGRDLCYRGPDLWHRSGVVASANERIHEAALRAVEPLERARAPTRS
jgi:3'(2'), 5'-bisphosphate nucleotidase